MIPFLFLKQSVFFQAGHNNTKGYKDGRIYDWERAQAFWAGYGAIEGGNILLAHIP
jgi:hypothetical protein